MTCPRLVKHFVNVLFKVLQEQIGIVIIVSIKTSTSMLVARDQTVLTILFCQGDKSVSMSSRTRNGFKRQDFRTLFQVFVFFSLKKYCNNKHTVDLSLKY